MKRIVVFALILNAALLGVIAQQFIALAGDDGPLATRQNGDVNGDQILDMSDAVYLLIHLFNGGAEPVALADSPEVLDRLDALERTVADLAVSTDEVVFHAIRLEGGVLWRCSEVAACSGRSPEDASYYSLRNNSYLSKCSITDSSDALVFSTNRDSDLVISFTRYSRNSEPLYLFMDGEAEQIDALYLGGGDSQSGETYSLVVRNVSAGTHRLRWASTVSGVRTQGFHQNPGLFDIKAIYISPN